MKWNVGIAIGLAASGVLFTAETHAVAQNITLDGTVGPAGTLTGPQYIIPQQAGRKVGTNLFHSFGQFNLNANEVANFRSTGITNILVRVTGGQSNLNGRIQAPTNFFLMNPAGIIFGRDARLAIRGSFVATTANAIGFPNGGVFSLTSPVDSANPLLTVNPSALLFNQIPQPIVNRAIAVNPSTGVVTGGLAVPKGQSLLLVGGEVRLDGGQIVAPGGRVELGSVAGSGTVGLARGGQQLRLNFPSEIPRSNVNLTNGANVNVRADNRGSIAIYAHDLNLTGGSALRAGIDSGQGSASSRAGNIDIDATGTIALTDVSFIANSIRPGARGTGGNINITTGSLFANKGAELFTSTSNQGRGNAGSVIIRASDRVSFDGYSVVNGAARSTGIFGEVERGGTGQGGRIDITAHSLDITNGASVSVKTLSRSSAGSINLTASQIRVSGAAPITPADGSRFSSLTTETTGVGNAGSLTINTGKLLIENGGQVSTGTSGRGRGGPLTVTATDSIAVSGAAVRVRSDGEGDNLSRLTTRTQASGNAGDLTLNTRKLEITGGAQVSSGTNDRFGTPNTGNGGVFTINAADSVIVSGESLRDNEVSRLTARTEGQGDAKALIINTRKLEIADGAQVSAGAFSTGRGGTLNVNALDSVEVRGASQDGTLSRLGTRTQGSGDARALAIVTKDLLIRDGGQVDVRSFGVGEAGNLEVTARSIRLDNKGQLTAEAISVNGGNIILQVQDLLQLRRNSQISATARAGGNGGNITINAPDGFIVAVSNENSDITASAFRGRGGNITINTRGIFGIQSRDRATSLSDITASSELGISGIVTINTPDIDPSRGLVSLPTALATPQVTQSCRSSGSRASSEFIVTGRGGLPPNPSEALSNDAVQVDLVTPNSGSDNPANTNAVKPSISPAQTITEAQGWMVDRAGNIILVAEAPTVSSELRSALIAPYSPWLSTVPCEQSHSKAGG